MKMEITNIKWRIKVIQDKLCWVSPPRERSDLEAQLRCQLSLLEKEEENVRV